MNAKEVFTERLNKRLEILKKTSAELSREVGVTPPTVLKYRNGSAAPSFDVLVQIAVVLSCSTDYLLGLANEAGHAPILNNDLSALEREMLTFFKSRTIEEQRKLIELARIAVK